MTSPKVGLYASMLLLAAAGLQSTGQTLSPAKPATPRVLFSDTSRLGRPFAKDPSVVKFKDRFLMYYSLPPAPSTVRGSSFEGAGWGIGIAASPDLIHWSKIGELPPSGGKESHGIAAPGARVVRGKVHLFYQTYGLGSADEICHAISDDGLHFVKDTVNPVYHPKKMSWSVGRAIDAEVTVVPEMNKAFLYFATRDPKMEKQLIGVAEAKLDSGLGAGVWNDVSVEAPVLAPSLPWEQLCIEAPTVVRHNGHFYMFYAGAYNNQPQQIGVAMSDDGIHYTRLSNKPFLPNGGPGTWNSSESGHPGVLQDGDQTYLFYQGNNDHGKTYFISMVRILWDGDQPKVDPNW